MITIKELQKIRTRQKQRAKDHPEEKDFYLILAAKCDETIAALRKIEAERRAERKAEK